MQFFGKKLPDFLNLSKAKNNSKISQKQKLIFFIVIGLMFLGLFAIFSIGKNKKDDKSSNNINAQRLIEDQRVKIDLPDHHLDTDVRWRNHYERLIKEQKAEFTKRLDKMEELQNNFAKNTKQVMEQDLHDTQTQLEKARQNLINASVQLRTLTAEEEQRIHDKLKSQEIVIQSQDFNIKPKLDIPKSAANYIPEGTYFTGSLLHGIVVSTALNTADTNATPVVIRLVHKGNLHQDNKLDISKCRIMGSAYGDISSERAIIRLEKMTCEQNSLYQTSQIAGQITGPDGFNGIKGNVVSMSGKHLNNAMLGGIISGIVSAGKGQDEASVTNSGLVLRPKKSTKELATKGVLSGVGSAAEKLADYYLQQAEAMSPVLVIPAGVRVNTQITKGFFVGESNTHKKIQNSKK